MNEACTALEIECKRVCNDLEFVSHRLETEFRQRPDIPDVVSLIRRIHALESNLSDTRKRSEELLQQRRRVANKATSLLLNNHSQLSRLIDDSGCRSQNSIGAGTGTSALGVMKISNKNNCDIDCDDVTASTGDRTESTCTDFNDEDFLEARVDLLGVINLCSFVDKNDNNSNIENIPYNNIIQSNNLIIEAKEDIDIDTDKLKKSIITETKKTKNIAAGIDNIGKSFNITLEQFEGVPVSIRGRCKLMDIQQVLTRLQTYYTTYINSHHNTKRITVASLSVLQPLSLPELTLSGMKVTGKTGDCVLGTLRSLGYIKIGKTGKTGILLSDLMVAKLLR